MKTKIFLSTCLLAFLFTLNLTAQKSRTTTLANPGTICKKVYTVDVKSASVRGPMGKKTLKAKGALTRNGYKVLANAPITDKTNIWIHFPFKPGYPSGTIVGVKTTFTIVPKRGNTPRGSYLSHVQVSQGPTPYRGKVRIDDPKNHYVSGTHISKGNFVCGKDYKVVAYKLALQPGDYVIINKIEVLFDCPTTGKPPVSILCPVGLPNPKIKFGGVEKGYNGVKRYKIPVVNAAAFFNTLFQPAPYLPACGKNTNASRSWVDIYDENNKFVYRFCALKSNKGLTNIWFAKGKNNKLPKRVRIVINDRACGVEYKSNWISIPQNL